MYLAVCPSDTHVIDAIHVIHKYKSVKITIRLILTAVYDPQWVETGVRSRCRLSLHYVSVKKAL